MKRTIRTIALILALSLLCPLTGDARGRNNSNDRQKSEQRQNRPGNEGRGHSNSHVNENRRPAHNSRPDNNKHQQNKHQQQYRPGNNNRPDIGNHPQGNRPSQQPGFRPQGGYHMTPAPPARPPHRPLMPAHRPWQRPTPPPAFRPAPGWRPINSILGIAFGSAINFTVNALINSGYNVTGYANDAVYIANATMHNMLWPDATLYYNNGGLYGSEFVYSTPYFNMNRYNSVYNQLVRSYGAPYRTSNNGGSMSATWWGVGNQFITLTFQSGSAYNGTNRFFTTLSFGN